MFERILSITKNFAIVKVSNNITDDILNYNVILEDGNYSDQEKKTFMEIVKNGSSFFFKYARLGGLEIA